MKTDSTFKITGWKEETILELEGGGALKRAHVTKSYEGKLHGEGMVKYLMAYKPDGNASFVGYETFKGAVDENAGALIFEHHGSFKAGMVDSTWSIVEGSGTGGLSGITGKVHLSAGHQEEYPITIAYELA